MLKGSRKRNWRYRTGYYDTGRNAAPDPLAASNALLRVAADGSIIGASDGKGDWMG